MTRALRKIHPSRRPTKLPPASVGPVSKFKIQNSKIVFVLIAILAAIPFSLGKYFEFNSPDPFDGGAYAYSAWHILNGAKIGIDEKPSAQPGTLLVNILGVALTGPNETGAKLVQMILQIAALILMFIALRKAFGTLAAAIGVIIASVYLSAPLIAKFGNVKEQYMIAFMIMGISCLVLHQLGGKWWLAFLAGAFMSWAPLFKQTGVSAIGATALFVILQPILKNRTWKQTGIDIALLWGGAIAAIAPLYIWILVWDVQMNLPYSFVWITLSNFLPSSPAAGQPAVASDYISEHRKLIPFSQQYPIVLRYYLLLILPVALATGAIIARFIRMIRSAISPEKLQPKTAAMPSPVIPEGMPNGRDAQRQGIPQRRHHQANHERLVLLLAVWWLLDMAFIWISPASYEQYYLPLNASAAMAGGYLIAIYSGYLKTSVNKTKPRIIGLVGFLLMLAASSHIFFGIKISPYTRQPYQGGRDRGYSQKLTEIHQRRNLNVKGYWELAADHIHTNSQPTDRIYVWGWYPGIYLAAQRFSAASAACCMPRPAPQVLSQIVGQLLEEFKKQTPKFIVDSRKRHVPTNRPPYELWPIVPQGSLGAEKPHFVQPNEVDAYDKAWNQLLREHFDEDEALRYEALKPLREFVMKNYRIVQMFGEHVLFELKPTVVNKEI